MKTITVKIESADDVNVTAKAIEDKWNFKLLDENKIKVKVIDDQDYVVKSVKEGLPDNLSYHIVSWELPSPNGESIVNGTRSAMCEIYKDKKWYGEDGVKLDGITHWMPFPKYLKSNKITG